MASTDGGDDVCGHVRAVACSCGEWWHPLVCRWRGQVLSPTLRAARLETLRSRSLVSHHEPDDDDAPWDCARRGSHVFVLL